MAVLWPGFGRPPVVATGFTPRCEKGDAGCLSSPFGNLIPLFGIPVSDAPVARQRPGHFSRAGRGLETPPKEKNKGRRGPPPGPSTRGAPLYDCATVYAEPHAKGKSAAHEFRAASVAIRSDLLKV